MTGHITLGEQIAVVDRIRREHEIEKADMAAVLRVAVDTYLREDSYPRDEIDTLLATVLRVADRLAPPPDRGERMLRSLTIDDFPGHSRRV